MDVDCAAGVRHDIIQLSNYHIFLGATINAVPFYLNFLFKQVYYEAWLHEIVERNIIHFLDL